MVKDPSVYGFVPYGRKHAGYGKGMGIKMEAMGKAWALGWKL